MVKIPSNYIIMQKKKLYSIIFIVVVIAAALYLTSESKNTSLDVSYSPGVVENINEIEDRELLSEEANAATLEQDLVDLVEAENQIDSELDELESLSFE